MKKIYVRQSLLEKLCEILLPKEDERNSRKESAEGRATTSKVLYEHARIDSPD